MCVGMYLILKILYLYGDALGGTPNKVTGQTSRARKGAARNHSANQPIPLKPNIAGTYNVATKIWNTTMTLLYILMTHPLTHQIHIWH